MHRFYLPSERCQGPALVLDERESHHAADVLRIRKGDRVTVLNGAGREFLCEVQEVHRKAVALHVEQEKASAPPPCQITLVQAVPKGKLMDLIIQKATELGTARIVPLLSERVTTQLDDEGAQEKAEKWQQVAVEAIKQCGQPWLPKVMVPVTTKDYLAGRPEQELSFVGSLQGDGKHPRKYFGTFASEHGRNPRSLAFWVGPEGDFTPGELDAIRASGVKPVSFGPLVLRCETAALYALSVANYELQARE